ncbi:hypothetical protein ABW636_12820 [Aquimarina sp. 2201CG1-2-11]
MKNKLIVFLGVLIAVPLFSGCGNDDNMGKTALPIEGQHHLPSIKM